MGITRMGFYFLLEIQASFYFSHTGFRRFKISKKFFLKIQILDIIEKCIRWVLVCPFLGVFFGLKVQKGCAYVNVLKIALVLIKNVLLGLKKGISRLLSRIAAKHTASTRNLTDRFFLWKKNNKKWKPTNCPCRICKAYIPNVGFLQKQYYSLPCMCPFQHLFCDISMLRCWSYPSMLAVVEGHICSSKSMAFSCVFA